MNYFVIHRARISLSFSSVHTTLMIGYMIIQSSVYVNDSPSKARIR